MINQNERLVFILGLPATGKTTEAIKLHKQFPNFRLIHTDDYIDYGWELSLETLLTTIKYDRKIYNNQMIIEGVLCYRLLKKGLIPDLIITVHATREQRVDRYMERKASFNRDFDHTLWRIWTHWKDNMDYNGTPLPRMIDINKQ